MYVSFSVIILEVIEGIFLSNVGGVKMLLSNNDIKRELIKAKNLAIYPLKLENVKGSSLNLTASKHAWRVSDKKSAVVNNKIIIPPNDTVCIFGEEAIWYLDV